MLKMLGASHAAFSVFKVTAQHVSEKTVLNHGTCIYGKATGQGRLSLK